MFSRVFQTRERLRSSPAAAFFKNESSKTCAARLATNANQGLGFFLVGEFFLIVREILPARAAWRRRLGVRPEARGGLRMSQIQERSFGWRHACLSKGSRGNQEIQSGRRAVAVGSLEVCAESGAVWRKCGSTRRGSR